MFTKETQLFSQPLVLGASISAGYGTRDGGLGAVLAKTLNPEARVINKAISGATSVQSTSHLDLHSLDPSVVLGLDLFFWDAIRNQMGKKFELNTKNLFESFFEKKIPLIIGKVPVISLPIFGPGVNGLLENAKKLNSFLEAQARGQRNCLLYDPVPCFLSMGLSFRKYFSDGLHLNSAGNTYCANYFVDSGVLKEFLT